VTALPTLDPEIADLGLALGLLTASDGAVELDSSWFEDPGARLAGTLGDEGRRGALVRFVDAVLAEGEHTETEGVTYLHLFNLRELTQDSSLPDLTVQATLDARPSAYVEVGLAVALGTTAPDSSTQLAIPLYRAAKPNQSVAQPFALLAGGVVRVATELTLDSTPAAVDEFGLAGVEVSVEAALVGGPAPSFRLVLKGLHLPGAAAASDFAVGGPGVAIEDALLSLVLGLVRQGADSLAGPAAAEVRAALSLLGLGDAAGIPPLPVDELIANGVGELRDWFVAVMGAQAARSAWLSSLASLLGGAASADHVDVDIGGGPVTARIAIQAATAPSGHLTVTPRLSLNLDTVSGSVRIGAEAVADLLAIDTATGTLTPVPHVEMVVTAVGSGTGNAANLLHTGTFDVGSLRLGLAVEAGAPKPLIQLLNVALEGNQQAVVDLSSPEAVVAEVGQAASALLGTALDALGAAGADFKALLGLTATGGASALDGAKLLADPLGTLADWWHDLLTNHAADVPAVLAHVRNLVAGPLQLPQPVGGIGTSADPWSISVVTGLAIDAWLDGGQLLVAPACSLRIDDLAGGCTVVSTDVRLQLAAIDLAGRHANFPLAVDLTAKLRARGGSEARLALGPVAIVADFLGVGATWAPTAGFAVDLLAPGLSMDAGEQRIPLVLPTVDADGHVNVRAEAWQSVEDLIGVLADSAPLGWLADLVDLTGWSVTRPARGPRLSLAELVAEPAPALKAWLGALATEADMLGTLTATIAHLTGGGTDGRAGVFSGSGTPGDPWLASLGATATAPALAVWLTPAGPVAAAALAGDALQRWRPGMSGLPPEGLAQALFDEARAGDDVAGLAAGRSGIAAGLRSLLGRWTGTDGMVAPAPEAIPDVTTALRPERAWDALAAEDPAAVIEGGLPAGAVVVRVAIATAPLGPASLPWTPDAGRLIDLTAPGLAPGSFQAGTPAAGEWVVALAPRADAGLGGAGDPTGLVGQAARLSQVLGELAAAGPVVLVAAAGAGHAARMAADAVAGVTHLITLGTPWSAATFDSARVGVPADAARLMRALLPPVDALEPDDADLALGRALVNGFRDAARGAPAVADLEAPRPTTAVRAGLSVVAVFGTLTQEAVERAMTAVFAAGLAARAQARAGAAAAAPDAAYVGLRVPFSLATPPGGHGVVVEGAVMLELASIAAADAAVTASPAVTLDVAVADSDAWLLGGPGTTPVGGAAALELRRLSAHVSIALHGGDATAAIVLEEGSALGADWVRLVVRSDPQATGQLEQEPLLPEAGATLSALATSLSAAIAASPAGALVALLKAAGVCQDNGALLPDGLAHLLHDPATHVRAAMATPAGREALLAALHGLVPELTVTGDALHAQLGPVTFDADLAAQTVGFTASGSDGVLSWHAGAAFDATGHPTFEAGLGDPDSDALALSVQSGPLSAQLRQRGGPPVALWPTPDVDGLARVAAVAVPAEALRVLLEGLRSIDNQVGSALEDLASALGMLRAPDARGFRPIAAPVALFSDPAAWLRQAGVLSAVSGGPFDAVRVTDLLEAIKPFVGLAGTPRGAWPIADGVQIAVTTAAAGPTLSLAVDATPWLAGMAGHPPVAAGITAGLTVPATGAPRPSVELFIGVPDGPSGTSTPQHRRAAHLFVDENGLRIVLRPSAGPDLELYPNPAGFGSLLKTGVTELLPRALNEVASMTGDAVRVEVADLVGRAGRGLAVASGTPAVFDGTALKALAGDPAGYLRAHLGTLVTEAVAGLDPLLQRLLGLAPANHVAVLSGAGVLTVTVRTVVVEVHPAPLAVHLQGTATGLPVIDAVALGMAADESGLAGWSAAVGPAEIDLDGPVIRPLARAAFATGAGWQAEVGLGLDDKAPTAVDHRELLARWRQADGLTLLATHRTGAATVDEDTSPEGVATAAIDTVLDLVGGWVLGVPDVRTQLDQTFGTKTVRFVLEGSVLEPAGAPADPPQLLPDVLTGWPDKLLTMAGQLAAAAPSITVGPFDFAIAKTGDVIGVSMSTSDLAGIDLTSGGDIALHLEADASWIEPPTGGPPSPGIVLDLLRVSGSTVAPAPGIAANGIGLRLSKASGPLIDAGLRLDTVAVHLFGSVAMDVHSLPELAGGVQVELGGLAVPLGGGGGDNAVAAGIMHDAGGSGAPPRPSFSPGVAVQGHGSGLSVTLRAGPGDGPWFLPIQRAFGPVYLEQVGLGVEYEQGATPRRLTIISLYLDGQVSLLGLTAAVDKLRFGYHVSRPFFSPSSWEVDVDGFAIASNIGGLTLAGGLRKFPLVAPLTGIEYLGMLKIGYGSYGIDLFGGYAHPVSPSGSEFASFFAFGVLHAPLGGPPAFFITGIGIGFGINRELHTPTIDEVNTHPFMLALRALGPAPEPMRQLQDMRELVPPAQGEYWVAAGISFTSFVLITGEILVTVQFGDGLEIAVLGLARAQLPTPIVTLVSIELALLARFSTKEGLLLVQAQLTDNSWLLEKSVRLTGGFAFASWWKGPNSGQFVITVGGYHPRFHHDGYPVVPRVGLSWQPIDNISVVGGVYFALCSEAIMAGAALEVAAHLGPAHASLRFGGDGIVFFDPFWFEVEVYAEAQVGITIWLLFGSVDIDVSLGFDVVVSGPPIHVEGHFSVCGVGIPFEFGDEEDPADRALDPGPFAEKYLRGGADAQVVQAAVLRGGLTAGKSAAPSSGGVAKPPDGSAANPFRLVPEFLLSFVTTAPAETLQLTAASGSKSATVSAPGLGVAPMYSATLDTTLAIDLTSDEGQPFAVGGVLLTPRSASAFPKGVWGPAQNPKAKTVPAGDTIDACDGLTIDTVLPDSLFTGAPPIDYHQIELPLEGRKPLPFVTNTTQTDSRVTAAIALKNAAAVLTAGPLTADVRFERAALVLEAAGAGRTTVAALRGERSAPPSFGSLADDLENSPAPESPAVDSVVVDRTKPAPRRFAPLVKSVLGVPLALTLERPGGTTVAEPGAAMARTAPSLAAIRSATVGRSQLALSVVPAAAQPVGRTLTSVGVAPSTRVASAAVGAVANARPAPLAADRLAAMSDQLLAAPADPTAAAAAAPAGAIVHEGELAVITIANRPSGEALDTLTVTGGATRILALAAGGRVLDDRVLAAAAGPASMELPRATERVALVAIGASATADAPVAGWCAGQSLPTVGWGAALAAGALVTAQANRVADHRERADGGWVTGYELARAAQVVTGFADAINAIAIVIDDYLGSDAAGQVSMRLLDAERVLDAAGEPLAPQMLVDGVRTILLYAITTTGPRPGVLVDGCGKGHLGGVLGTTGGLADLAALLVTRGVDAAVGQPLVGGPEQRQVSIALADGPVEGFQPRRVARRRRRPAKRSARKAPARKART
jgi:large repetitive protein